MNIFKRIGNAKSIQQPKEGDDDDHSVDNGFYFAIHGYQAIDKPKQNAHDDERN
jgi:hypothetical protein